MQATVEMEGLCRGALVWAMAMHTLAGICALDTVIYGDGLQRENRENRAVLSVTFLLWPFADHMIH